MKTGWGYGIIWIGMAAVLAACSAATSTPEASESTVTATGVSARTRTPSPTHIRATATRTPLPTIPTFTATFDARTIVTVTPAPRAECPDVNKRQTVDIIAHGDIGQLLDALNQGIPIDRITMAIDKGLAEKRDFQLTAATKYDEVDLSQDGVPELILPFGGAIQDYYILGCKSGKFQQLFEMDDEGFGFISHRIVPDANRNGLPEVMFSWSHCTSGGCTGRLVVVEWDGSGLRMVLNEQELNAFEDDIWIKDVEGNSLKEFGWDGGIPFGRDYDVWEPWRIERHTYRWNGSVFAAQAIQYRPPGYRFQAIQDGDSESQTGQYTRAVNSYMQVIWNEQLGWWSNDRFLYRHAVALSKENDSATPTFIPEDRNEHPRLAAYAYYRMIILHVRLGEMDAAQVKYDTLQKKFPEGNPGHPYAEMAAEFWNAWQTGQSMYDGCAAAIEYAAEHAEILGPLGSDYHGAQSHTYIPADVCPFR